jgi:hypothetical protein
VRSHDGQHQGTLAVGVIIGPVERQDGDFSGAAYLFAIHDISLGTNMPVFSPAKISKNYLPACDACGSE